MPDDNVSRIVRAWFEKADHDLRAIELLLPSPDAPTDVICFHAQQAAEKYIKGYLTHLGLPFTKTHDLVELAGLAPAGARLPLSDADLAELSIIAVAPRYPGSGDDFGREEAQHAVELAMRVKAAVLAAL